MTGGDWTRFEVGPSSGTITYVGPNLPETGRYELQVTARDTGRLTQAVTVTVASAASSPRTAPARAAAARGRVAVADTARTYADLPVLIDVLANDAGLDGAHIVAVTASVHGTTTVVDGMVRYVPTAAHRGRDTFNYTVVLDGGQTARATVTVMVVG